MPQPDANISLSLRHKASCIRDLEGGCFLAGDGQQLHLALCQDSCHPPAHPHCPVPQAAVFLFSPSTPSQPAPPDLPWTLRWVDKQAVEISAGRCPALPKPAHLPSHRRPCSSHPALKWGRPSMLCPPASKSPEGGGGGSLQACAACVCPIWRSSSMERVAPKQTVAESRPGKGGGGWPSVARQAAAWLVAALLPPMVQTAERFSWTHQA